MASCMRGSVVMMTHATFGTMSTGRCAKSSNHCEEVFNLIHCSKVYVKLKIYDTTSPAIITIVTYYGNIYIIMVLLHRILPNMLIINVRGDRGASFLS